MSVQIFIENNVSNRDDLIKILNSSVRDFTTETLPNMMVNRIGFLWSFNSTSKKIPFGTNIYTFASGNPSVYFTQEFVTYLNAYTNRIIVDLIVYPDNFEEFTNEINKLKLLKPNITFNYSVVLITNTNNLIAESSGENITSIFFNDQVDEFYPIMSSIMKQKIKIIGTNFYNIQSVNFNGTTGTESNIRNPQELTIVHAQSSKTGFADVVIETDFGIATSSDKLSYVSTPTITAVSKSYGPSNGTTNLTITGTGFYSVQSVKFNGLDAVSFGTSSPTEIFAVVPVYTGSNTLTNSTSVSINIKTLGGETTNSELFTWVTSPMISSIKMGHIKLDQTIIEDSVCDLSGGLNFYNKIPIKKVTITGTNFYGDDIFGELPIVIFNGIHLDNLVVINPTTLIATIPTIKFNSGLKSGKVFVSISTVGGSWKNYTNIINTNLFEYTSIDDLQIDSIKVVEDGPSVGTNFINRLVSTLIEIKGNGFINSNIISLTVNFNGIEATNIIIIDNQTMRVKTPLMFTNGPATTTITNLCGTKTFSDLITFVGIPKISNISTPGANKSIQKSVVITGDNYYGLVKVYFINGTTKVDDVVIDEQNPTEITITTPDMTGQLSGTWQLYVENYFEIVFKDFIFADNPTLSYVKLSGASIGYYSLLDTTSITLVGEEFYLIETVKINEIEVHSFQTNNTTELTVTQPALNQSDDGLATIYIKTIAGEFTTNSLLTLVGVPNIDNFSPIYYLKTLFNNFKISGSNLYNTPSIVTINGKTLNPITFTNSGEINGRIQESTSGLAKVEINTLGGTYKNYDSANNVTKQLLIFAGPPTISSFDPLGAHRDQDRQGVNKQTITIKGTEFYGETSGNDNLILVKMLIGTGPTEYTMENIVINDVKTQIQCTIPTVQNVGDYKIKIITPVGFITSTKTFKYVDNATVSDVSPNVSNFDGSNLNINNTITDPSNTTYKRITITGTQLYGVSQVKFGNNLSAYFTVSTDGKKIEAALPASSTTHTEKVPIEIITYGGLFTFQNLYIYAASPTITSINLSGCKINHNTQVVISGTNFYCKSLSDFKIKFNGALANIDSVNSAGTELTITTPLISQEGSATVELITGGGTYTNYSVINSTITRNLLYFRNPPTIQSVSVTNVSKLGGTTITITGTNFYDLSGNSAVQFGFENSGYTNSLSCSVTDENTLSVGTPRLNWDGPVTIKITTPYGEVTNSNLSYAGPPTITQISQTWFDKNKVNTVTITGTNFYELQTNSLKVNSQYGTVLPDLNITNKVLPSSITVTLPIASISGTRKLIVITPYGREEIEYIYIGLPNINFISESTGPKGGNQEIKITGSDLYEQVDASGNKTNPIVKFGDNIATIIPEKTSYPNYITVTTPSSTTTDPVSISITGFAGTTTKLGLYTYTNGPVITSIQPSNGNVAEAQTVLLYGDNFYQSTVKPLTVTVKGTTISPVQIINKQTLKFTIPVIPSNITGYTSISVTSYDISTSNNSIFLYYQNLYLRTNPSTNTIESSQDKTSWSQVSWPLKVNTKTKLSIETDLVLNSTNWFLNISGSDVEINGNGKIISIDNLQNYPGFVANGSSSSNGYNNITINNISIKSNSLSTLSSGGGWVCQKYFGKGVNNITVTNCNSDGAIGLFSGGIFGSCSGNQGKLIVNKCCSAGNITGRYAGGIFGASVETEKLPGAPTGLIAMPGNGQVLLTWTVPDNNPISNYQIQCSSDEGINWTNYLTKPINENAIITGLTNDTNYIFKVCATNNVGTSLYSVNSNSVKPTIDSTFRILNPTSKLNISVPNNIEITVTNCYSIGDISGESSGGIFADCFGKTKCTNSYSLGAIKGKYSGGIYGINFYERNGPILVTSKGSIHVSHCFASGNYTGTKAGGIYPMDTEKTGVSISKSNNYVSNGSWNKDNAMNSLLDGPKINSTSSIYIGDIWTMPNDSEPWLLSAFDSDNYQQMSVSKPELISGNWISTIPGLFSSSIYNYSILNITKKTSAPLAERNIGIDGKTQLNGINNTASYGIEMISHDKNYLKKFKYNISVFYINPVPLIKSVSPKFGYMTESKSVTLTGKFFSNGLGTSDVSAIKFINKEIATYHIDNNAVSFTFIDDKTIIAQVPPNYFSNAEVIITGSNGDSVRTVNYYYETNAPEIAKNNPTTLITVITNDNLVRKTGNTNIYGLTSEETTIEIRGSYFNKIKYVKIGNKFAKSYEIKMDNDTVYPPIQKITAVLPYDSPGLVDIFIENDTGLCTYPSCFEYILVPPIISSMTNYYSSTSGGSDVIIYGLSFYTVTIIKFGDSVCSNYSIVSPTKIIAKIPPSNFGEYPIKITNNAGTTESTFIFTYSRISDVYIKQISDIISYSFDSVNWENVDAWPFDINLSVGRTFYIMTDLDLSIGGTDGYFNISCNNVTVEGNNKTISVSTIDNYPGLFNSYGNFVTVKNIKFESTTSTTANDSGWFFPTKSTNIVINDCTINSNATGDNVGGFFGSSCSNISASNCYNTSIEIISGLDAGGIFGPSCSNITATNCYSKCVEISGTNAGGIFGSFCSNITATNCYSQCVEISGTNAGGIFGPSCSNITATDCYINNLKTPSSLSDPKVKITGSNAGGIFGLSCSNIKASNCYNKSGEISGQYSGGIFGKLCSNISASDCYIDNNAGIITGSEAGGIFGSTCSKIIAASNCYNNFIEIYGENAGGIFGKSCSEITADGCFINNNASKVTGTNAGGIFGSICSKITAASNCYGKFTAINGANAGGIFGSQCFDVNATSCYIDNNTGKISGSNAGGIFGSSCLRSRASNCYFNGIQISGEFAGGIFGRTCNNCDATGCSNISAEIIGQSAGGIFGSMCCKSNATFCKNNGQIKGTYSGGIFGGFTGINKNIFTTIPSDGNMSTATNCINYGTISGYEQTTAIRDKRQTDGGLYGLINTEYTYYKSSGGIFGFYSFGTVNYCINFGNIEGSGCGGIFGSYAGSYKGKAIVTNSYSLGSVSGHFSGGIFGYEVGGSIELSANQDGAENYAFDKNINYTPLLTAESDKYNRNKKNLWIFNYGYFPWYKDMKDTRTINKDNVITTGEYDADYLVFGSSRNYNRKFTFKTWVFSYTNPGTITSTNNYCVGIAFYRCSTNTVVPVKTYELNGSVWSDSIARNTLMMESNIWYSIEPNKPFLNTTFVNKQNYIENKSYILTSNSGALTGYKYKLVNGTNTTINTPINLSTTTINQDNGIIQFTGAPGSNYTLKTLTYKSNGQNNIIDYNFSDYYFNLKPRTINEFTPLFGNSGQQVEITGTELQVFQGIKFGETNGTDFVITPDGTQITAKAPENSNGKYQVTLLSTQVDNHKFVNVFTYGGPTIKFITPLSSYAGSKISVYGEMFKQNNLVIFNDYTQILNRKYNSNGTYFSMIVPYSITDGSKYLKIISGSFISTSEFLYSNVVFVKYDSGNVKTSNDNTTWVDITWPVDINKNIIFTSDITINLNTQYFEIKANGIIIDGNGFAVNVIGVSGYSGLFKNGGDSTNGFSNCVIKNLGINVDISSSLSSSAGWLCQTNFGKSANSNTIINCYSTGQINGQFSGGILGSNCVNLTVSNCYSIGEIFGDDTGGIVGASANNVNIKESYSMGSITGASSGGFFGSYATSCEISNSYSNGEAKGTDSSGIFGKNSSYWIISGCYVSNGNWTDAGAKINMVDYPTSNLSIGKVWTSYETNKPFILSSFNKNIYEPQYITNPGLNLGNYQTPSSVFANTKSYSVLETEGVAKSAVSVNISGSITFTGINSTGNLIGKILSFNTTEPLYGYNISNYYINPLITFSSFTPTEGSTAGNNKILITGKQLNFVEAIGFGDNIVKTFIINNTFDEIIVVVPKTNKAEDVMITLFSPIGLITSINKYSYKSLIVNYVSPVDGSINKNTSVDITGINLSSVNQVKFNNNNAVIQTQPKSDTKITVTPPTGQTGNCSIELITSLGNVTLPESFVYGRYT